MNCARPFVVRALMLAIMPCAKSGLAMQDYCVVHALLRIYKLIKLFTRSLKWLFSELEMWDLQYSIVSDIL